jgi:hypothetical protein
MDARSQVTLSAALAGRASTWLRDEEASSEVVNWVLTLADDRADVVCLAALAAFFWPHKDA